MAMSGTLILGFPEIQDLISSEPAKFVGEFPVRPGASR